MFNILRQVTKHSLETATRIKLSQDQVQKPIVNLSLPIVFTRHLSDIKMAKALVIVADGTEEMEAVSG